MDEVLEKFEATFVATDPAYKTDFQELYKNWGRLGNQEERRKELLEIQKSDRRNKLDKFRGIFEIVQKNEEQDLFRTNTRAHYVPNIYVAGFNRSPSYHDILMLSEWIIEKPDDFNDNWYITPCPKGKRVLCVASYGITKLYTKCGRFVTEARTKLPGGNPNTGNREACTVLDCFYDQNHDILYVLDLLAWNNQPMSDCDTEFRQFWLKSQFDERPQLKEQNKTNRFMFKLLPMVPCTPKSLNTFLMTYPPFQNFTPSLDGLLFYHKRAHYISGETPLVGWLYPYMVPEVLGSDITIHPQYMADKPADYVDQATFIQKFEEKYSRRRNKDSKGKMDTTDSSLNKSNSAIKENNAMDAEETVKDETELMAQDPIKKNKPTRKKSLKDSEDSKDSMEAEEISK